jgi:hypothetical protein
LGTSAITHHLPKKDKQAIIFGIQIGVPQYGYIKDNRINKDTLALVDTGATGSCISRRFAINAQLRPFGRTKIKGFEKTSIVPVYIVDLLLPNGISFTNIEVAEYKSDTNFDCIIGMDILRRGDMALTNAKDEMVFSFRIPPAEAHIDFVKEEKNKQ